MVNNSKSGRNLRALVESALLIAVGFVLSYVSFSIPWVQGGSVTPLSMLPIMIIGIRHGLKWGLCSALVYSGLQMLQSFAASVAWLPSPSFSTLTSLVLLDYVIAFSVLGLSGLFKNKKNGLLYAIPLCITLRFLCHFISGLVIWNVFAEAGQPVWLYSLIYNGSYMGPELVLTMVVGAVLCSTAPFLLTVEPISTTTSES